MLFSSYSIAALHSNDLSTYCSIQMDIMKTEQFLPRYYIHSYYYINNYINHLIDQFINDHKDIAMLSRFAHLFKENSKVFSYIESFRYLYSFYTVYLINEV